MMMRILSSFALSSLLAAGTTAFAAPRVAHDNYVLHESRGQEDALGLQKRDGGLSKDTRVPLRIALQQQNLDKGMDLIMEVSDPASPNYGNHYTPDQIVELFGAKDESVKAVTDWLEESGIPAENITIPKSRAWVNVESTVGHLEPLLRTRYQTYGHPRRSNLEYVAVEDYSLPERISQHVDFVIPGVAPTTRQTAEKHASSDGPAGRQASSQSHLISKVDAGSLNNCAKYITPACIRAKYDIPLGKLKQSENKLGIFAGDALNVSITTRYNQTDLNAFYKMVDSPKIPEGFAPETLYINTTAKPSSLNDAGEINLDLMISMPIIYPQQPVIFQSAYDGNDQFNTFLDGIDGSYCDSAANGKFCGKFEPTPVISFSYGLWEYRYSVKYVQRQCNEFMKLGLQGITLVFSSGDSGVANSDGVCLGKNKDIFTPAYPPGCPYVTAIGGSAVPMEGKITDDEIATEYFSSGGGFSNIFKRPSYQADAVAGYLKHHKKNYTSYETSDGKIPENSGIYNRAGRAYPDMSALGQNGLIILSGNKQADQGTSMSAPLVAAIFNRINGERIKAGKKQIGFVNPTLYKNPQMFNDVVSGSQPLGGHASFFPSACGNTGFNCTPGWDPVTGLGTPKYPTMLKVFMDLP